MAMKDEEYGETKKARTKKQENCSAQDEVLN
jgi:hypothetical protein